MNLFSRFFSRKDPVILVTIANLINPLPSPLVRYDTKDKTASWVDLGNNNRSCISSGTGLASSKTTVYVMTFRYGKIHVYALDRNTLRVKWHHDLEDVKDAHSITVLGKHAYIISTGTDQVMKYEIGNNKLTNPEVIWAPTDAMADTHHLNSIVIHKGDVLVSGFGPKKGDTWKTADDGYIYNISKGTYLKTGIYHPHALVSNGGKIYYCDSFRSRFMSIDEPLVELEGYVRGASFANPELVYIGTSKGRKISKSTGAVNNTPGKGLNWGFCGVTGFNLNTKERTEVNLDTFGIEVYDVLYLS